MSASEWRTNVALQVGDETLSNMLNKVCQVNHLGNPPSVRPVSFWYYVNGDGDHLAPRNLIFRSTAGS